MPKFTLEHLDAIVKNRAESRDPGSYTVSLMKKGIDKCAEKFGEEAVEAIIAAATKNGAELTKEAADVLYHLLVLLKISGIPLDDVMNELERRTAQTGLQEKASR